MKKAIRVLELMALAVVIILMVSVALAESTEHDYHYAWCYNPDVCAVGGEAYSGTNIYHEGDDEWYDNTWHIARCDFCGEVYHSDVHAASCDNPDVCMTCGGPIGDGWIAHYWEYEHDEENHWRVCTKCGEEDSYKGMHYVYCMRPGVCYECGIPFSGNDNIYSIFHPDYVLKHDDDRHWWECVECGDIITFMVSEEHYADCQNPGVCSYCGAPYTGDNLSHADSVMEYDDDAHWGVCTDCGEIIDGPFAHYADCQEPGICRYCGSPYSGDNIHHGDYTVEYDADTHWDVCNACGEISWGPYVHAAECQELGICWYCGISYSGDNIVHGDYTVEYDADTHWDVCDDCGEISWGPYEHFTFDGDPEGICSYCGCVMESTSTPAPTRTPRPSAKPTAAPATTPAPTETATPEPTATPEATEEPTPEVTEEPETTETPMPSTKRATLDNPLGKLAVYENGGLVDYTGFETFEEAEFYFEHGVIRDDMDGLTLIGDMWYNMDHGRFNMGDGIVFFEGGTFLVKGGLIDETQTGLITYNGQQFVFAHGQFQSNVHGAWCDPITGKFVYIWAGQFYPITDLVSYDGHVFYFINGYLATDFTGIVKDFQGTEFNIIGGQAY